MYVICVVARKSIFMRCFTGEIEVIQSSIGYLSLYVKSVIENVIMMLI